MSENKRFLLRPTNNLCSDFNFNQQFSADFSNITEQVMQRIDKLDNQDITNYVPYESIHESLKTENIPLESIMVYLYTQEQKIHDAFTVISPKPKFKEPVENKNCWWKDEDGSLPWTNCKLRILQSKLLII